MSQTPGSSPQRDTASAIFPLLKEGGSTITADNYQVITIVIMITPDCPSHGLQKQLCQSSQTILKQRFITFFSATAKYWRGLGINVFFKKKSCLFLCLNPMALDFKEEESVINTSEVSKKAQHLWLCDVEKLMTTISGLCRDRRLLS